MEFIIDIEVALEEPEPELPDEATIKDIITKTLIKFTTSAELCVRIVEDSEITILNNRYRQKNNPTNVLSFPMELPKGIELDIKPLGDIIIASNVVKKEAIEQNKPFFDHFCHMLIHGILHLLGFDHQNEKDATKMETEEINIMHELNLPNPYI